MKNLILVLTFLMSFNSFSRNENVVPNIIEKIDTSHVSKEIYRDVKSVIVSLASGLKTTSEHILTIYGKHFFLDGIYNLIISTFCLICLIISVYYKIKTGNYFFSDEGFPLFLIDLVLLVGFFIFLYHGISLTFNPEYHVIKEIIENLKDL